MPPNCVLGHLSLRLCRAGRLRRVKPLMESGKAKSRTDVCLLAPHSAALREMRLALSPEKYTVQTKVLTIASARVEHAVPAAHIYVIDIEGPLAQVAPAVSDIIHSQPSSLFIATAETFHEANTFPMLRLGIKGIVEHAVLDPQLEQAIETVAAGGYWVPRVILSEFVSSILKTSPRPPLERAEVDLSRARWRSWKLSWTISPIRKSGAGWAFRNAP